MTLNQLRYFCTASRCHSITKAAEELYVTQPTVSVAIRDLEIEFGINLFSRKGNQLMLTVEGEALYKRQSIFAVLWWIAGRLFKYIACASASPYRHTTNVKHCIFPELLEAFQAEHPEIPVVLEEYGSVRACSLVQDDTLDLHLSTWNSTTSTSLITLFSPMIRSYFAWAKIIH